MSEVCKRLKLKIASRIDHSVLSTSRDGWPVDGWPRRCVTSRRVFLSNLGERSSRPGQESHLSNWLNIAEHVQNRTYHSGTRRGIRRQEKKRCLSRVENERLNIITKTTGRYGLKGIFWHSRSGWPSERLKERREHAYTYIQSVPSNRSSWLPLTLWTIRLSLHIKTTQLCKEFMALGNSVQRKTQWAKPILFCCLCTNMDWEK